MIWDPLGVPDEDRRAAIYEEHGIPYPPPDFLSFPRPPLGRDGTRWRITVTASTRRGTRNLRTFYIFLDGYWYDALVRTRKQVADERRGNRAWVRVRTHRLPLHADPAALIHLAEGVDITADMFGTILNALYAGRRRKVHIDDIKRVVSQLGSRIPRLGELHGAERNRAEIELYTEILDRCTIMQ